MSISKYIISVSTRGEGGYYASLAREGEAVAIANGVGGTETEAVANAAIQLNGGAPRG